ncbi:hypothetical protein QUA32_08160 [Microcoleus sp. Pol14D6]
MSKLNSTLSLARCDDGERSLSTSIDNFTIKSSYGRFCNIS